jgi:hypothetical protein
MRSRVHSAIVGVLLFCAILVIGHSATITVTNNNDSGPGSLRQRSLMRMTAAQLPSR